MSGRRVVDGVRTVSTGRESELTPDVINKICDAIKIGCFPQVAAMYANVLPSTFRYWIRRGIEEPDSRYGELLNAVRSCLGQAEMRDVAALQAFIQGRPAEFMKDSNGNLVLDGNGNAIKIRDEVRPNITATMFKMERRWAANWGRQLRVDISSDILNDEESLSNQDDQEKEIDIKEAERARDNTTHILKQLAKAGYLNDDDSGASE